CVSWLLGFRCVRAGGRYSMERAPPEGVKWHEGPHRVALVEEGENVPALGADPRGVYSAGTARLGEPAADNRLKAQLVGLGEHDRGRLIEILLLGSGIRPEPVGHYLECPVRVGRAPGEQVGVDHEDE